MSIYQTAATALVEADMTGDFEQAAEQILPLLSMPEGLLELTRDAARQSDGAHPNAYMHSNGFLKVEYFRGRRTGFRIRGHFWNPAWGATRQNPHNHAFDFRSHVVLGAFDHRHFAKVDEGDGQFHFGYRYSRAMRAGVDQYSLERADPAWLQQSTSELISVGTEYNMGGDQLHALDPVGDGLGATAIISRPYDERRWSEIYSLSATLDQTPRNAKLLDLTAMIECVESVITVGGG